MKETFIELVQRLESITDSILEKPLKENLENVEEEYRRGHEPQPLPLHSKVIKNGRKAGVDKKEHQVYEFNGYFWSWDRMHGEWEVFIIATRWHFCVMDAEGDKKTGDAIPNRRLEFKVKR